MFSSCRPTDLHYLKNIKNNLKNYPPSPFLFLSANKIKIHETKSVMTVVFKNTTFYNTSSDQWVISLWQRCKYILYFEWMSCYFTYSTTLHLTKIVYSSPNARIRHISGNNIKFCLILLIFSSLDRVQTYLDLTSIF